MIFNYLNCHFLPPLIKEVRNAQIALNFYEKLYIDILLEVLLRLVTEGGD